MLVSAGKSALIGEILTINDAASDDPGERQKNERLSTDCLVHFCGTVQEISCCSQEAVCPPETAAACAAVGAGTSTLSSCESIVEEDPPPPVADPALVS